MQGKGHTSSAKALLGYTSQFVLSNTLTLLTLKLDSGVLLGSYSLPGEIVNQCVYFECFKGVKLTIFIHFRVF